MTSERVRENRKHMTRSLDVETPGDKLILQARSQTLDWGGGGGGGGGWSRLPYIQWRSSHIRIIACKPSTAG